MVAPRKALLDFLEAYAPYDKQIHDMLKDMARDASRNAAKIAGLRSQQIRAAGAIAAQIQRDMYTQMYALIKDGQIDMAKVSAESIQDNIDEMLSGFGFTDVELAIMRSSSLETAASGIATAVTRMTGSARPLSSRVYRSATGVGSALDRTINSAIAQGKSAREIAKDVYDFIDPATPGGASYAARRLGRTELNNAYHASARQQMQKSPFVNGVEWALSGSHGKPDVCDDYAGDEHYPGGDPGVFKPNDVPDKPHPQCLCSITPVLDDDEEFLNKLVSGEYDTYLQEQIGGIPPGLFGQRGGSVAFDSTQYANYGDVEARVNQLRSQEDAYMKELKSIEPDWKGFGGLQTEDGRYLLSKANECHAEIARLNSQFYDDTFSLVSGQSAGDPYGLGLTDAGHATRDLYVVNDSATLRMNAALRAGRKGPAAKIARIDAMIEESTLKTDLALYRGAILDQSQIDSFSPGAVFTDLGFQSTDLLESGARFYADARLKDGASGSTVIFNILVGSGRNAVNVGMGEVVLPRGLSMRVVSKTFRDDVWNVVVEVL